MLKYLVNILLIIGFLHAQDDLEKVSLQLKWKYQFQFAGFIIAKEKGFYKDARANKIKNFTGINSPYEPPENPNLVIHTDTEDLDESVSKVLNLLTNLNIVSYGD